jgi:hypothetical protein
MNNTVSLQEVIGKLEMMFSKFNNHFYGGKLEAPVITVSPEFKNGVLGWCTSWKAWKCKEDEGYYEINLCSEYLSRPFPEVAETLLHEMVHLYNLQNGIKDTSRGGTYHNGKFKDTAEKFGLICEKGKSGWNRTKLTEETLDWIIAEYPDEQSFPIYRERLPKISASGKSKTSSRKYVCPECETIIRATKEVHVVCGECDVPFEER